MKDDEKLSEIEARREFLKRAGQIAAAAPAVAVLLSAASKPASAGNGIYQRIPT
jgi:hypothetical protein